MFASGRVVPLGNVISANNYPPFLPILIFEKKSHLTLENFKKF